MYICIYVTYIYIHYKYIYIYDYICIISPYVLAAWIPAGSIHRGALLQEFPGLRSAGEHTTPLSSNS
jgi:hypothetical protein